MAGMESGCFLPWRVDAGSRGLPSVLDRQNLEFSLFHAVISASSLPLNTIPLGSPIRFFRCKKLSSCWRRRRTPEVLFQMVAVHRREQQHGDGEEKPEPRQLVAQRAETETNLVKRFSFHGFFLNSMHGEKSCCERNRCRSTTETLCAGEHPRHLLRLQSGATRQAMRCMDCWNSCANAAIMWQGLPVPVFGNHTSPSVRVATVGLNPSATEFLNDNRDWKLATERLPLPS